MQGLVYTLTGCDQRTVGTGLQDVLVKYFTEASDGKSRHLVKANDVQGHGETIFREAFELSKSSGHGEDMGEMERTRRAAEVISEAAIKTVQGWKEYGTVKSLADELEKAYNEKRLAGQ